MKSKYKYENIKVIKAISVRVVVVFLDQFWSTISNFLFRWVKRDSYLPVGSQGLKAVTKVGFIEQNMHCYLLCTI